MLVDPGSRAIVQAIVSLANALGLEPIAEGVESEEQRKCLALLGCHCCQGYLFGQPLPADRFEMLFADSCPTHP